MNDSINRDSTIPVYLLNCIFQYFISVAFLSAIPALPEIVNGIQFALQNNVNLGYVLGFIIVTINRVIICISYHHNHMTRDHVTFSHYFLSLLNFTCEIFSCKTIQPNGTNLGSDELWEE